MARLAELISGFSDSLAVPAGTVKNTAAVLRAAGLLTSGPRGPGAPHMGPTDATNLLLGLMYDDLQENAAVHVPRLRDAALSSYKGVISFDDGGGLAGHIPPHSFIGRDGQPFRLGQILDEIFDTLVRHGRIDFDPDDDVPVDQSTYVKNFDFSISRPGYEARMWIDAISVHWTLAFRWLSPEDQALIDSMAERGETIFHPVNCRGPAMSRTRSIRDEEINSLADVLRGGSSDTVDFNPDFVPAYQSRRSDA